MSDRAGGHAALVLLDNVVLSNFLLAGAMPALAQVLAGRGGVTPAVLDENVAGRAAGHDALGGLDEWLDCAAGIATLVLPAAERAHCAELIGALGRGEASCIAAAAARCGVFASDDAAARRAAAAAGVRVTGTIGLLVAAVRDGVLDEAAAERVHRSMCAAGFHSPVHVLKGLLP